MSQQNHFNSVPQSTPKDLKTRERISRTDLKNAMDEFLKQGGTIQRVEPLWLEEVPETGYHSPQY